MAPEQTQTVATLLTNDNPVSKLTLRKILKDFVADALLSLPASLIMAGITGVPQDTAQLMILVNAVAMPVAGALYRATLRWAQSPD